MKYFGLLLSATLIACGDGDKEPSNEPSEPSNEAVDADGDGFVDVDDCDYFDANLIVFWILALASFS